MSAIAFNLNLEQGRKMYYNDSWEKRRAGDCSLLLFIDPANVKFVKGCSKCVVLVFLILT